MRASLDRNFHLAVGIHDVHLGNLGKTVILGSLHVCFGICTATSVGSVAFHDSAIHLFYQLAYKCRLEKIVSAWFSCRKFYCHTAAGLASQSLIDFNKALGRYVTRHVHLWFGTRCNSIGRLSDNRIIRTFGNGSQ